MKRSSGRAPPAERRHARHTGAAALALLCATAAAALVLAQEYHLGVAATLVTILVGLPALYLAWLAYRDARRGADTGAGLSLAEIADELAFAVRSQWEAEAATRRLNDPYPLPVSWGAADPSLTDPWDSLVRLAASGAGWPAPTPENWARDRKTWPASGDRKLVDVLATVPTGRLVVLGEPGAGKTMLMVRPSAGPACPAGRWRPGPGARRAGLVGSCPAGSAQLASRPADHRPPCPGRRRAAWFG